MILTLGCNYLKNSKGQFVVEAVLLMTLAIALLLTGLRILRERNTLSQIVQEPWGKTAGMVENGAWITRDQSLQRHPNNYNRAYTPKDKDTD